jgi:hypothetical protein
MICFQTKNPNLGKFWRDLQWKMLVGILVGRPFGLVYGHCIYFMAIWYSLWLFGIFPPNFGMLYQEKSGNPVSEPSLL